MQVRPLGQEDCLEEGMATRFSILAWSLLALKRDCIGTSLAVQWLRLCASTAGGTRFDLWLGN